MRRRAFLIGLSAFAAGELPCGAWAAPTAPHRIGYVYVGSRHPNVGLDGLLQGLADNGYVVGRDLILIERYGDGRSDRIPALIQEVLALDPDILVTIGTPTTVAAHQTTTTVPIVCVTGDPVGAGLAASLAHPGGNVTGLSLLSPAYAKKWVELLKAAVPGLSRLAFLLEPGSPASEEEARQVNEAAPHFGVTVTLLSARRESLAASLSQLTSGRFDGLIVGDSALLEFHLADIIELTARNRLPAIYGFSTVVKLGGLMSYSADFFDIWRRAAGDVDRILKGAKPGELPIEQAAQFKLAVNLTTAKNLDLELPPMLLALADEVIE